VAKFLMVANQRPNIDAFDSGLRRRLLIVECAQPLPEQERDADLGEKLQGEKSGILNWMLQGWCDLLEKGLRIPEAVRIATDQFFNDKNEVSAFLDECTDKAVGERVSKTDFYEAYRAFCIQDGIEPRSQKNFGQILKHQFGFEEGRVGSTRFWRGNKLKVRQADGEDLLSKEEQGSIDRLIDAHVL
jgi:putative DNA primase/helicase